MVAGFNKYLVNQYTFGGGVDIQKELLSYNGIPLCNLCLMSNFKQVIFLI